MLKEEYNKILDWLEDFISSGQADEELGSNWEEDLEQYLKDNFDHILGNVLNTDYYDLNQYWTEFYTLFFKKEKYIIENNVLIRPCLKDIKKAHDIPNTVKEIGEYAFYYCSPLTSIDLPNVTTIGNGAFYQCKALTSVDLPQATSIGGQAFQSCSALTSVTLGNTLKKIAVGAFYYDCKNLKSINFKGRKEEWNKIKKSEGWINKKITIHCNDGDFIYNY